MIRPSKEYLDGVNRGRRELAKDVLGVMQDWAGDYETTIIELKDLVREELVDE